MTIKPLLLATACALAFTGPVHANGWYASLEAGAIAIDDTPVDFRFTNAGVTTFAYEPTGRFDNGWAVVAAVGYALQNWRIEAEIAWRSNDKDQFTGVPVSTGDLDELTAMYNMTYAFPLAQGLDIAVGGGAGLDYAMLDIVNLDDADLNFAYQGIAEINYALSPSTEVILAYRYLHVLDPSFEDHGASGEVLNFDDIDKHTLTAGIRVTFQP